MSATFEWCKDKTRLATCDKPVFFVNRFGDKCWRLNGQRHRVNGPAIEWSDGGKLWYLNGELHRENGPAVEHTNGNKSWYLNGKKYYESDYWMEINK